MCKQYQIACSVFLAALLPVVADAEVPTVAELPTPKIGEVWKYRTIDLWNHAELSQFEQELVEIQADRLVFRTRRSKNAEPKTGYSGRGASSCRRMRDSEVEMCDGPLKFPLHVGDKTRYDNRPWRNGKGHNSAECEVKAVETVTVPAGTFDAFRVECDGSWQRVFDRLSVDVNSGRFEETLWYSPKVNDFVKWTHFSYGMAGRAWDKEQTELTEFVPK